MFIMHMRVSLSSLISRTSMLGFEREWVVLFTILEGRKADLRMYTIALQTSFGVV